MITVEQAVEDARRGENPAVVCRVPSGWVVLCNMQFLTGYCILLPDPVVGSLNALEPAQRASYLCDMALVGDALLKVTDAYRINYAIMGNSDPALHAHIIPRYLSEPEIQRKGLPWSYTQEEMDARGFDPERDADLIRRLNAVVQAALAAQQDQ